MPKSTRVDTAILSATSQMNSILAQTEQVDVLLQTLMSDQSTPQLNLDEVRVDPKWSAKVPAPFAIRRKLLPLCCLDGVVRVATSQAIDPAVGKQLTSYLGNSFLAIETDPASLQRAITRVYGTLASSFHAEKQNRLDRSGKEDGLSNSNIALVDEMIQAACLQSASDIHLIPCEGTLKIQFRIDGVLENYREIPMEAQQGLINRLKVMAELDIAEKRAPQDGSFSMHMGKSSAKLDIRLATLPTRFGERLTMRLLGSSGSNLSIPSLGMRDDDQKAFENALARPHGLVLLTGPTGSGKSTTLYAAISELLRTQRGNIITVEDPIEYEMPGVSQVEVDSSDRLSFGKALRSLLRHDPDIVMIGEIRDAETANVAVKASLTGHLVLSTLHTNSAVGVVSRLVDMGVERFLVAATLQLSVAQRLVRKLCPHCRRERPMNAVEASALRCPDLTGSPVFDPQGCVYCAGRGYSGRLALFEMLNCSERIASQIASGIDEHELWAMAQAARRSSLSDDGIAKLLSGQTSVREVISAVSSGNPL
ncbi:MAG: GspE/PulE family protein [Planctomycetota bacterium]|nr:GspE/PulE family protein [Planctomycetota bacterium]